ncbi:MAG: response regulator, partial [Deltaproteobacteria bacterium]|nr:response regulator [Deltaproteobacteria bacterium]
MNQSASWKIVLIDDEHDIREVMTIALEDSGYEVFTANDGKSGVKLCKEVLPHIVITDIRMPEMDGLQVLETLKTKIPDTEVIVTTAFGEMDLAIRALQLDASDFVTKPINDQALNLALKRAKNRYTSKKQLADYTALLEKENAETSQQLIQFINFQKNLIESSMDGILACDATGTILTFNKSMETITGHLKKDVIHKKLFNDFLKPGEEIKIKAELANEKFGGKDRLFLYETSLRNRSNQYIPVQLSATALKDHGQENGIVCFFRDLRQIKKLEHEVTDQARILHQDKMMSLGRLSASVVHEINNPLSGILNYVRLMIRVLKKGNIGEEKKEKFERYLDLVEKETQRCSQIVSGLLTFSRKSTPSFEKIEIHDLMERCVILSQHKLELSNITLERRVNPNLPLVYGDMNQLQQCIINLIFNAVDSMPQGGILKLEGRYESENKEVVILVEDNGPGISPKNLPHIFEPFFTTKDEGFGVGLGLSTVYGILEHHNGTIDVE